MLRHDHGVAEIVLDRPEAMNAINSELAHELIRACLGLASAPEVRAVVLSAALRHGWGVSLESGLDIEDAAWRTAALSADRREGIAAFAEKRAPAWPGA